MVSIIRFHPRDDLRYLFDQLQPHQPLIFDGENCLLALRNNKPVACCTLEFLKGFGGIISHYQAIESTGGVELLKSAIKYFRSKGADLVVGPMGDRFWGEWGIPLSRRAADPDLKPDHYQSEMEGRIAYLKHWDWAGFIPITQRFSVACSQLFFERERVSRLVKYQATQGEEVRSFDLDKKEEQLRHLFDLFREFRGSLPFVRGIDDQIEEQGEKEIKSLLDPDYLFFSYDKEKITGFCFAHRDQVLPSRLIVRALYSRTRGLRHRVIFVDQLHRKAYIDGIKTVIHSMLPQDGGWQQLLNSYFDGKLFRRYQLLGVNL